MQNGNNPRRRTDLSYEQIHEGIGYIRLFGDLDISGVQEISLKFTTLSVTGRKPTIVDLSEVTFISSLGIGMMMADAKSLRAEGKIMILLKPNAMIEKVLKLACVPEILPIEDDLQSALNRAKLFL